MEPVCTPSPPARGVNAYACLATERQGVEKHQEGRRAIPRPGGGKAAGKGTGGARNDKPASGNAHAAAGLSTGSSRIGQFTMAASRLSAMAMPQTTS